MDQDTHISPLLELIERPVLLVRDGTIIRTNRSARMLQIQPGDPIRELLGEHFQAYDNFREGELYVTVTIAGIPWGTTVMRWEEADLFILESDGNQERLQAFGLAAQQLGAPLTNVMTVAEQILHNQKSKQRELAGQLSRGLFQLLRMVNNMGDVQRFACGESTRMELTEFSTFIGEIVDKARTLLGKTGVKIHYKKWKEPVFGLAAREDLTRCVHNLISNAVKFAPAGSTVTITLTRTGDLLSLRVRDLGSGIPPQIQGTLFSRYQRQPGIEDSRHGIGIGMTVVRSVAAAHGGTVLVDQPRGIGTRVTLTIRLREEAPGMLRSPIQLPSDRTGGWDRAMIEFSQFLPPEDFE